MALQCNIDAKGKRVRFINGIVTLIAGIALLFAWALPTNSVIAWVLTIACLIGGAFMIFEARAGWCVIRVWESDVQKAPEAMADQIAKQVIESVARRHPSISKR